jgi:hypothetical protein
MLRMDTELDGQVMPKDIASRGKCYCDLWESSPETLSAQGIPRGFCGLCVRCGKPGHLRHAPEGPFTDARCDDHFDQAVAQIKST